MALAAGENLRCLTVTDQEPERRRGRASGSPWILAAAAVGSSGLWADDLVECCWGEA